MVVVVLLLFFATTFGRLLPTDTPTPVLTPTPTTTPKPADIWINDNILSIGNADDYFEFGVLMPDNNNNTKVVLVNNKWKVILEGQYDGNTITFPVSQLGNGSYQVLVAIREGTEDVNNFDWIIREKMPVSSQVYFNISEFITLEIKDGKASLISN